MSIIYFQPGQAGLQPNTPNWVYIETNDTVATVTATGYLNGINREMIGVLKNNQMALVSTKTSPTIGVLPVLYTFQIQSSSSGSVWSLVAPAVDVPVPFIVPGNIQAGLSGTAGDFISYPATAATGFLELAAVSNAGNTGTIISNDSMAQASTISIPDPGNAAGQFMIGATATPFVSGNFPKASGTAGLFVDSGVAATGFPSSVTVTMNTAAVTGAFAAPVQIIAAPGASSAIIVLSAQIITEVSTAFATGGVAQLQYGNTIHGGGTICTSATIAAAEITAATSQIFTQAPIAAATVLATATFKNLGIFFSNATQAFTNGAGSTVTVVITYTVVPAV